MDMRSFLFFEFVAAAFVREGMVYESGMEPKGNLYLSGVLPKVNVPLKTDPVAVLGIPNVMRFIDESIFVVCNLFQQGMYSLFWSPRQKIINSQYRI